MPQPRLPFVQTSPRRGSSISDDVSGLSSQHFNKPDESQTSQCQSSRPRTASTTSSAKPRTSWVFSHMPDEEVETRYYNQRTGKEEWRCKHCDKAYSCSGGTAAPAKHLTDPPPDGHGLQRGAPRTAKVTNIRTILEQARVTAEESPRKRRRLNDQSGDSIDPDQLEVLYVRFITACSLPINEFNRSHALLSLAFPCLFPDGRADFVEPRLRSIEYKDYIEHAMRWHDGRFARHPTFRFVAFNTLMRSQARARSKFFVKQHDGTREPLTREQLLQALEHSEDPEAQALINSITRQAVSIRGTRPFWNRKRQDLEAYAYDLGCPGAFITFSPADLHWRSLYQHMPRYGEWLRASEPERMALSRYLLRQNPHIAAFHFHRRYCLFRDVVLRTKFNVTDYWDRYEWQGRGSPHNHGLYWMENGPVADMGDEAARDLFARTWGFHITAVNPEPRRTVPQGEGNPLSVDPLGVEMTFLRLSQIVNRCQRHRCNTTYCLRVRKGSGDLARDMEGAAADIEAANAANPEREKEGKSYYIFEAARNDSLMNHFNPAIILGWLANIDISPCTSLQAVITYAAKYCSKSEKKTEPYCRLADQVLPHTAHHQPLLSFSSRLMNKLIAERDYSAQEISHLLLNIPLQEGTRMVVYVDCRPLEQHVRSYRVDEDFSEAVGSYRKYLQRNDQHESITYLEYLQSYNLKTWRRLGANAKKRVLSYFPRYRSAEASPQFHDFCRVKLMMTLGRQEHRYCPHFLRHRPDQSRYPSSTTS
ncbi:hypothetical protein HIM_10585 [Hirsutella minnesotensis 3608]|uniref:Helitron helicase-like domain-containing protein n=1 Tax=Hirsutella minnesotensis 3608 TaxID=1043627 RepID=A0A0F8A246_9HYPO|nr:hypothetical protein HIM_10585 [Hirsutella minnesotensis 3608]